MKEIRTLQPYNFRELPPEMQDKAEKMIADISPIGEVNEDTVDAVEAWSREDVLVLMRAMYNEALRQPRPIPSDVEEAAEKYNEMMSWAWEAPNHPHKAAFIAGAEWERNKTVPSDVQEAAYQYAKTNRRICSNEVCERLVLCGNLADAFKAGIAYERERLMKEAVECNVIWYDGRLLDFTQEQLDAALDKIGAGVDAKVSVIIIKKEK